MTLAELLAHPLVAGLAVASLTGTASAATATLVLTFRNHRLLMGESGVEDDRGLVGEVRDLEAGQQLHRHVLVREGMLETRADGGEEQ